MPKMVPKYNQNELEMKSKSEEIVKKINKNYNHDNNDNSNNNDNDDNSDNNDDNDNEDD